MDRKRLILFLGTGPDSLHLMGEGFARSMAEVFDDVVSASLRPSTAHPAAVQAMRELGIDIRDLTAQSPVDIEVFSFELVVTLGEFEPSCRPDLPGMPPHFHWNIQVPDPEADPDEVADGYRLAARLLEQKVRSVFASDMLHGLAIARRNLELVLDNLAHAVMAHTMNRRIFYFNQAAEKITGYSRRELLGKDCHEVFAKERFCGGDCLFCGKHVAALVPLRARTTQVPHTRRDGAPRVLDMNIVPLSDATGRPVGALLSFQDSTELQELKRRVSHRHHLGGLVGRDPKMLVLFEQIREVASVNVPVLIEGESGTGKELIAAAIHQLSPRAGRPFVPVNCGALPEGILESELFGHVRGAFTGAIQDKKGRFEMAAGGTLLLDEVAELPLAMQVKLLRVLQEQTFERVGGERSIHVDVRILSATNQNLRKLMERGTFRRDLYYRLCVVPIVPPPLRDRRVDIPILVDYFLEQIAREEAGARLSPSNEALDALMSYSWPGNVRELRNVIEFVHVKCRTGTFGREHLPPEIAGFRDSSRRRGPPPKIDRDTLLHTLEKTGGNRVLAAKALGVGRTTLYRYLASFGLDTG